MSNERDRVWIPIDRISELHFVYPDGHKKVFILNDGITANAGVPGWESFEPISEAADDKESK